LSLTPVSLALASGATGTVAIGIIRNGFTGEVDFSASGAPTGVTLTFTSAAVTGDTTSLKIDAAETVAANTYPITIQGLAGNGVATVSLMLKVTGPATVLLVDDDASDNNQQVTNPMASPSDTLMAQALVDQGLGYHTFVVQKSMNGPTADALETYSTVVWYTGDAYGDTNNVGTISALDEIQLEVWLDLGGKRLIIVSDKYLYGLPDTNDWTTLAAQNKLLSTYIGATGAAPATDIAGMAVTVSGVASTPSAGLSLSIGDDSPLGSNFGAINPAVGTDTLFTTVADPDASGTARPVAVATGRKNVGAAMTSKLVYVGFPIENVSVTDKTNDTQKKALAAIFAY
jgi:hypothetical protein